MIHCSIQRQEFTHLLSDANHTTSEATACVASGLAVVVTAPAQVISVSVNLGRNDKQGYYYYLIRIID